MFLSHFHVSHHGRIVSARPRFSTSFRDARPDSDVDLLYVRVPGNDLGMSYFDLPEDLEELFGRPVDLVSKEGLHRVIRDQVLSDAQVLYAA